MGRTSGVVTSRRQYANNTQLQRLLLRFASGGRLPFPFGASQFCWPQEAYGER